MCNLILSLPPELKHNIAIFCDQYATLASLALVHSSYQAEAERILYKYILICLSGPQTPLNTLKSCSHKAALVRSLTVEMPRRRDPDNNNVTVVFKMELRDALTKMHALTDLRVRVRCEDEMLQSRLESILSERIFNLHTLHCNQYFNIPAIINAQSDSLRTLGIRGGFGANDEILLAIQQITPKETNSMNLRQSMALFAFERDTFLPFFNALSTFPQDSGKTSPWRPILESYESDRASLPSLLRKQVSWVRIFLEGSPELDTNLGSLVKEMILIFPEVSSVELLFQHTPEEARIRITPFLLQLIFNIFPCRTIKGTVLWPLGNLFNTGSRTNSP
ncbi:hypothetical protein M422DRAFT_778070 [Sphaerobolus stellatus SS14]|nr:hypothetical protein M422DRAFT_778070 [Sphaerobolus stellatus SS14]